MHAETLAYMFHWLDYAVKRAPNSVRINPHEERSHKRPALQALIPAGEATLGQGRLGHSFGWDNESILFGWRA